MLEIAHVMFKYYDSLREDVLVIVLSLIIIDSSLVFLWVFIRDVTFRENCARLIGL